MKIVLDFDDTTFNTHQMMGEFVKISGRAGFTEDEFWTAFQKCKEKAKDLNIKILADFLYKDFTRITPFLKKEEIIKGWSSVLIKLDDFIYPDFFNFIKGFNKRDLILLSFGISDFHKTKIKNSKVASFFNDIILTAGDKAEKFKGLVEKYDSEKMFFIEDSAEQIDQVKKEFPQIITFKMERPQGKNVETNSELTDYVVENLEEVRACLTFSFRLKIPRFLP